MLTPWSLCATRDGLSKGGVWGRLGDAGKAAGATCFTLGASRRDMAREVLCMSFSMIGFDAREKS
jgi:hypothetical protein